MHSRIGLACGRALGISLCDPPPLRPPLIVLGIVVVLCSMPPWHSVVATPCVVSCSLSYSASLASMRLRSPISIEPCLFDGLDALLAVVLCDTCGEWTSGALSSTCGFMMSARIASPCFPRPRFVLGHAFDSHALSSHELSDHPLRCIRCWPVHAILLDAMTVTLDVFDDSATDSLADGPSLWFDESSPTSTVRSFCRVAIAAHRCAVFRAVFHDEWNNTAASSRSSDSCVTAQFALFSTLSGQHLHAVLWKPNLFCTTDVSIQI